MKVAVLTADYGKYDSVKPTTVQTVPVDEWIYVTDDPDSGAENFGWTCVHEVRPHLHTNVAAKVPKFRPDLYTDADITIWKDAGASIGPDFVNNCLIALQGGRGAISAAQMAMFPHPVRTRIDDEVVASRSLPKYNELDLEGQVLHYASQGYPIGYSLWATGCIVRNHHMPIHKPLGDAWLREVVRWGFQDQISFAYLAWKHALQIAPMGPGLWNSPDIQFGGHLWAP